MSSLRRTALALPALPLALVAAATLACSAERIPIDIFEPFEYQFTDATGDTLANTQSLPQRALDVTRVSGSVDASTVTIELTFSTPVHPWSAQTTGSVDGFIDFDLDEDSDTGVPGAASEFGGDAPLGSEYYLSLRDLDAGGNVSLVRVLDHAFVAVPATWSGNVMRVRIPRRLLPDTDGRFRTSVVVGHPQDPATDFAPSTGFYVVSRP